MWRADLLWIKPKEHFGDWAMNLTDEELARVFIRVGIADITHSIQLPLEVSREMYKNKGQVNVTKRGAILGKPFWRATYCSE